MRTLLGPRLPPHTEGAWMWFWELSATRDVSEAGLRPITHQEIRASQYNMRTRRTPLEVLLVLEADGALRAEVASRRPIAVPTPHP